MSIINDALNKAHSDDENNPNQQNNPDPDKPTVSDLYKEMHHVETEEETPVPPSKKNGDLKGKAKKDEIEEKIKKRRLIMTTILGFILFIAFGLILIAFTPSLQQTLRRTIGQRLKPKKRPEPIRTYKPGDIVLSGTIVTPDRTVALINDSVYEEGDMINGKKIITISLDSIELRDEDTGKVSVLKN